MCNSWQCMHTLGVNAVHTWLSDLRPFACTILCQCARCSLLIWHGSFKQGLCQRGCVIHTLGPGIACGIPVLHDSISKVHTQICCPAGDLCCFHMLLVGTIRGVRLQPHHWMHQEEAAWSALQKLRSMMALKAIIYTDSAYPAGHVTSSAVPILCWIACKLSRTTFIRQSTGGTLKLYL